MADFLLGKKRIDSSILDELETRLLSADVGFDATTTIIDELQNNISRKSHHRPETLCSSSWRDHEDHLTTLRTATE